MRIKADQSLSKTMNQRMILDIIRCEKAISRRELVQQTGLSGGAVTMLVQELIDAGLVIEGEAAPSSGGRKPIPLSIDFGSRRAIGIKVMEERLEAIVTDLAGAPLQTQVADLADTRPETVARSIQALVTSLAVQSRGSAAPLIGIGLALPGFVDAANGIVRRSERLGWVDVAIADHVTALCHLPAWVENDSNAYAIAHRLFGLARNAASALVVVLGTGVGAALIVNGQIFPGAHFQAGEFGFYRPNPQNGRDERLGGMHTLGALQQRWSIESPVTLHDALARGDQLAITFVESRARQMGGLIGLMIRLLDPENVVIGGENLSLGSAYMEPMLDVIHQTAAPVVASIAFDVDNNLWTRGAAHLAISRFFDFDSRSQIAI